MASNTVRGAWERFSVPAEQVTAEAAQFLERM